MMLILDIILNGRKHIVHVIGSFERDTSPSLLSRDGVFQLCVLRAVRSALIHSKCVATRKSSFKAWLSG